MATYSTVYLSWNEGKSRKLRSASWWLPPPMSEAYEAAKTWERREVYSDAPKGVERAHVHVSPSNKTVSSNLMRFVYVLH